ncbi:peptide chain release factor N(5)-glutamine methyltransferase [Castellaniella sp.]|uniref:peptide chain release factor N(5)-glutamine methyltransferase n=1 Tax=Castellaniella sp. TaxID=1955812 RepID=UPI003C773D2C
MADHVRDYVLASTLPRLESRMLWQKILGVSRAWLIAHDTDPLSTEAQTAYQALEARRLAGEPMAYILGYREFWGRDFQVGPEVLIPRPETELLVELGLQLLAGIASPAVLDLGTGSGIVGVSIALDRPDARVTATDQSTAALSMAQLNARALGASLLFSPGNWYDTELGLERYHLIVSNPPYIDKQDVHLGQGDLRFEPRAALTDEADGLDALRAIVQGAPRHLLPGAALCVEHGWDQAVAVQRLFVSCGFIDVATKTDLAGIERLTWGRWPA